MPVLISIERCRNLKAAGPAFNEVKSPSSRLTCVPLSCGIREWEAKELLPVVTVFVDQVPPVLRAIMSGRGCAEVKNDTSLLPFGSTTAPLYKRFVEYPEFNVMS